MKLLRRSPRVVADTIVGYVCVAAGLVMLLTPGPGLVAIVAGLALLGRHYRWARRWRDSATRRIQDTSTRLRARRRTARISEETGPTPEQAGCGATREIA